MRAVRFSFLSQTVGVSALLCALLPVAAQAQTTPPPSAPLAPTREEILRGSERAQTPGASARAVDSGGVERAPCPLAAPEFGDIRLTLTQAQFTGSGTEAMPALGLTNLEGAYSDLIGQNLPVSAVCDIRDRAATILRKAGYLAAVRVPVQTIEGGVVKLEIIAARLTRVEVRGDAGPSESLLAKYLAKLEGQPVFNLADAERYLLLARDIPGIDARLVLRPGGAPGEVVGEVTVQRTPIVFDANVQNYSSRETGRISGIARVSFNGLTGMGDQTTLGYYTTADLKEQRVVSATHEFRVGSEGLKIGGGVTYAWTKPDVAGLPLASETLVANGFVSYPLVRKQTRNLMIGGGFDLVDQTVRFGGVDLTRDKLRVASARVDANWFDPESFTGNNGYSPAEPGWSLGGSLEARQGLSVFGASDDCGPTFLACFAPGAVPLSRVEADPTAFVLRGSFFGEVRPHPLYAAALTVRAQRSAAPLLSYEEFSAGNFTVGRGFDPGTLIGDSGVGFQLEQRYGTLIPKDHKSVAWQAYVFLDGAWVWNEDLAAAGLTRQYLASAGGGLRMTIGNWGRLDVGVAVPLRPVGFQTEPGKPRFLFSITTQFGSVRK